MNELATTTERAIETRPATTSEVGQLIQLALERDKDPAELYALLREERSHQARQAFNAAKAAFLANCPPVVRRSTNEQFVKVSKAGIKRKSKYADLDDIQSTIDPVLARHGLTYRWGSAEIDNTLIRQSCILSHSAGHEESATVSMPFESKAGSSPQQKYAAASTYARRYSLIAVIGIRGVDDDDDGNIPNDEPTLTDEQVQSIEDTLEQLGGNAREGFLKWQCVDSVGEIPASRWPAIEDGLRKKIVAQQKAAKEAAQ